MFSKLFNWLFGGFFPSDEQLSIQTLSYKSRINMEKALKAEIRKTHPQLAGPASEHIANFVFNFGDYGFQLDTPQDLIQLVTSKLDESATLQSVAPDTLCRILVHRALEMKLNDSSFESHMRDLWSMGYAVIGTLTPPAEMFPSVPLRNLANRIRNMTITARQQEHFEQIWKAHPSFKRLSGGGSNPVDKKP